MNHRTTPRSGQTAAAFQCIGCGATVAPGMGVAVTGHIGSFPSCHRCRERALRSPRFRAQFNIAAHAGVSLPDVQRAFASIGADVPTVASECDAAIGLPAGSTAAALADGI